MRGSLVVSCLGVIRSRMLRQLGEGEIGKAGLQLAAQLHLAWLHLPLQPPPSPHPPPPHLPPQTPPLMRTAPPHVQENCTVLSGRWGGDARGLVAR